MEGKVVRGSSPKRSGKAFQRGGKSELSPTEQVELSGRGMPRKDKIFNHLFPGCLCEALL